MTPTIGYCFATHAVADSKKGQQSERGQERTGTAGANGDSALAKAGRTRTTDHAVRDPCILAKSQACCPDRTPLSLIALPSRTVSTPHSGNGVHLPKSYVS